MTNAGNAPSRFEWDRLVETVDAGFSGLNCRLDGFSERLTEGSVKMGNLETRVDALEKSRGANGHGNGQSRRDSALIAFGLLVGGVMLKLLELVAGPAAHALAAAVALGPWR